MISLKLSLIATIPRKTGFYGVRHGGCDVVHPSRDVRHERGAAVHGQCEVCHESCGNVHWRCDVRHGRGGIGRGLCGGVREARDVENG